jgi:ribosome-binding protein aMBF1 (putative translation factor)
MPSDKDLIDALCEHMQALISLAREAANFADRDLAKILTEQANLAEDFIVNYLGED